LNGFRFCTPRNVGQGLSSRTLGCREHPRSAHGCLERVREGSPWPAFRRARMTNNRNSLRPGATRSWPEAGFKL
jgi:hypothetical protein